MIILHTAPSDNPYSAAADSQSRNAHASQCTLFSLQVDDQSVPVDRETIHDCDRLADLRRRCLDSSQIVADLSVLLTWRNEERRLILQFLAGLGQEHGEVRYRCCAEGDTHDDLPDAILSFVNQPLTQNQRTHVIKATVEAATYGSHDALQIEIACGVIAEKLRAAGVSGLRVTTLIKSARSLQIETQAVQAMPGLVHVRDFIRDAPCAEGAVVPPLWILTSQGITTVNAGGVVLVPAPVVISRLFTQVHGTEESVEVAWFQNNSWRIRIVGRGIVATARTIVGLAGFGLPVTSSNASALVDYLLDFMVANQGVLPECRVSNQMGWIGVNSHTGFLWGTRLILESTAAPQQTDQQVTFQGADVGDQQLVDGLHANGTFEGWRDAIAVLACYPRARLALIASLAPPLLKVLAAKNFTFSLAGATSVGKTTALRISASCWGCPDERSPAAAITTWDATRVFIERALATLNFLPLVIDDTKRARRPQDIAQTVYDVTSGRGRGRGTEKGIAGSGTWQTVMITSGESSLVSFSEDGGTRARVLELWGSPFGERTPESAAVVGRLNESIQQHYGHAGPRFVQHLLQQRDQWVALQNHYQEVRQSYQQRAGDNSVAGRMAEHFAVLHIAEELACHAQILPWATQQTAWGLWDEITSETNEADRAAVALRYVVGWCHAHQGDFLPASPSRLNVPTTGWVGRWHVTGRLGEPECLAIYPHRLEQILKERDFEPTAIRRQWKDRGWLRTNDAKTTLKVRHDNVTTEMVAIRWDSIREVMGEEV